MSILRLGSRYDATDGELCCLRVLEFRRCQPLIKLAVGFRHFQGVGVLRILPNTCGSESSEDPLSVGLSKTSGERPADSIGNLNTAWLNSLAKERHVL